MITINEKYRATKNSIVSQILKLTCEINGHMEVYEQDPNDPNILHNRHCFCLFLQLLPLDS